MGIPEEDLGPRWLRDYGSLYDIGGRQNSGDDGGTGLKVDMPAMSDFASALRKNVDADYVPHANKVFADMTVPTGPTNPGFAELYSALQVHQQVQQSTTENVANHGNGASVFAEAANKISTNYQQADAYAAARVQDVHRDLGVTPPTQPTTQPGTDPTTNPAGDV